MAPEGNIIPILPASRPYQAVFHAQAMEKRYGYIVWHRRAGKDLACWVLLIQRAMQRPANYWHVFPTHTQARKALWESIDNNGKRLINYVPSCFLAKKPNDSEMKITLINGSIIYVLGSNNEDALRGPNPWGVIMSEYAYQRPNVWPEIIQPILLANNGWAIFNTTPAGKNHAYDLYNYAERQDDWFTQLLTVKDTGVISEEAIKRLPEQGVSEEKIQAEYYCNWNRGVEGTFFGRLVEMARLEERICKVPLDSWQQVYTACDIGYTDYTAIWFFQIIRNEVHFIDYYQASGEGLQHYARVLDDKAREFGYRYAQHFAPHDMASHEIGSGKNRLQIAKELGINFTIVKKTSFETGIELSRKLIMRSYFDETKCAQGIKALENYRKKYDEARDNYSLNPIHDWASHGADAFRYASVSMEYDFGKKVYSGEEMDNMWQKWNR
jgi:phage terminase large subunit